MTSFLDKEGLKRYHDNAVNAFAAKSDVIDLSQRVENLENADKATTLSGYGITDAYTKSEVDAMLKNYYPKKEIDDKISSMENTIRELKSIFGVMGVISIGATGKDGDYTLQLLSTTGGGIPQGTSSSIDGSTLVCGGTFENNSLLLTGATIDATTIDCNTLVL